MSDLKITGKFLGASEIKTIGDKGFKTRDFWIELPTNNDYDNTPQFQLTNDRCTLVDNLKKGEEISVKFSLNGRKWSKDGKDGVITNLTVWKIERITRESAAFVSSPAAAAAAGETIDGEDKLPF